jgi:hypothetical protein
MKTMESGYIAPCIIKLSIRRRWGTRWHSWLRHCATSQKVTGSIPDVVTGIFHWQNPSGRNMALGLTQSLTEMSTRNIFWGAKTAGAWSWQPYYLHVSIVLKSGSLNLLESSGPVQPCNGIALPLPSIQSVGHWSNYRVNVVTFPVGATEYSLKRPNDFWSLPSVIFHAYRAFCTRE